MAVITYKVVKIINTIRRNYVMRSFRSFNNVTNTKKVIMIHNNTLNVVNIVNGHNKSVNYFGINNNNNDEIIKLKKVYRELYSIINDVIDDKSVNSSINKNKINNFVSFIHNSNALNLYSKKLQDNSNDFTYFIDTYKEENASFLANCTQLLRNILHMSNKNNYIHSALGIDLINSLNKFSQSNAENTFIASDKIIKDITGNDKLQIILTDSFNDINCKNVAYNHILLSYTEGDNSFIYSFTNSQSSYNMLGNKNENYLLFISNENPQYIAYLGSLRNFDQIKYCELNSHRLNALRMRTLDQIIIRMIASYQKQNIININKEVPYDFSHKINRLVKFDNDIVLHGISSNYIANKFREREKEIFNNNLLMDDVD